MDLAQLRQILVTYFNKSELRDLCFDLQVNYEGLAGSGKRNKARELIAHLERHGHLPELVEAVRRLRPHVFGEDASRTRAEIPHLFQSVSPDERVSFSNSHALLIGVGADLPITVQDATALKTVLVDPTRAAYPLEQVELLTEAAANRQGILDAFDRLIKRTNNNPNAAVLVYFSGHGGRIERPGAPPEYFLIPYGYDPCRRTNTAISGLEFTDKIKAIEARKLVIFLDCCHAGGVPALKEPGDTFVKSPLPPDLLGALESGSGWVVVASSQENEYSYTGTPYSVFTTCLLEALEGKAVVNQDGYARILDVLIYLFKHVPERAAGSQHPLVKRVLDLGDNFPLCYYAGGSKHAPGQAPRPEPAPIPSELTPGQHRRLEQKLDALQREWDLRSEKVKRMRVALAIEAGVSIEFQLEQQILKEEIKLVQLDGEMNRIEQVLR
jgi:hypothetical protein